MAVNVRVQKVHRSNKFFLKFLTYSIDFLLNFDFTELFVTFVTGKIPEYTIPEEWHFIESYVESSSAMLGQTDDNIGYFAKM